MLGQQLDLGLIKRTRDFVPLTTAGIIVSAIYGIVYIIFLIQVVAQLDFAHGYLRPDLRPGPFTSDRYSIEWIIVLVAVASLVPLVLFAWMFYDPTASLRRTVHLFLTGFLLFFDLLALVGLIIIGCFFCNGPINGGSICNDPNNFCRAYADTFPNRCVPTNNTVPANTLVANPAFSWLGIWLAVMTVLNALTLIINSSLAQTARRYTYRTLCRGRFRI